MKKILKKIISILYGKKQFQWFFELLYKLSLRGMNFGLGDLSESGEFFILNYLKEKKCKNTIIFDVGANQGQYANMINKIFKGECNIYSFEPSKFTFKKLSETTKDIKKISINNFGLGSGEKNEILNYEKNGSGLASIYKRKLDHFNINQNLNENISIKKLDDFCSTNSIKKIDLLKIDVEGYELEILRGAQKMIDGNNVEMLQFEFGGCNIDSKTYFRDFYYELKDKYKIYRLLQNGLREITEYTEDKEIFLNMNYFAELKK